MMPPSAAPRSPVPRPPVARLITLRLIVVAILAMIAQVIVVSLHYGLNVERLGYRVASREAERVAGYIAPGPDGHHALILPDGVTDRYSRHPEAYAFQIIDRDAHVVGQMNTALFPFPPDPPATAPDLSWRALPGGPEQADGQAQGKIHVLTRRFDRIDPGLVVRIAIAADPDHIVWWVLMHEVIDHVAVPMIPLALLMLVVNVLAVRRSLMPLDQAAGQARLLDPRPQSGSMRLSTKGLPREVYTLVSAVNAALGRVDEVLRFQREFTANVAHELRTPLAVLTLHLDEIGGPGAAAAKRDVQAMARLVDQLLKVAQIEGLAAKPPGNVDLAQVARGVVQQLAPLALDQGREIEFQDNFQDGEAAVIPGHRDAIAGALRNLVDNALRATPRGTVVTVGAGPGPILEVSDRGPGIAADRRRDLFDRFAQGDTRTRGSAGLGLAIVAKTMEIHAGSVEITDRPGGGTCVTLCFPAEPLLQH